MQRQYVRFQMKTSNRPQTIAEVHREVDIKSFRENPEWYEIVEKTTVDSVVFLANDNKETKLEPIKKAGRPRKEKQ